MLVWDCFRAHLMDEIKKHANNVYRTDLATISGGLTSILQPLDVSINKPFKDKLREKLGQWLQSGILFFIFLLIQVLYKKFCNSQALGLYE